MKKLFTIFFSLGGIFATDVAHATLAKVVTDGDNVVTIERKGIDAGSELEFKLWPNRKMIAIEGVHKANSYDGDEGRIQITIQDKKGKASYVTDKFYVYLGKDKKSDDAYKECIRLAIEASEKDLGIKMTIKNGATGWYNWVKDSEGHAVTPSDDTWASFGVQEFKCEQTPHLVRKSSDYRTSPGSDNKSTH